MVIGLWLLLGAGLGIAYVTLARLQEQHEKSILAVGLLAAALAYWGFGVVGGAGFGWLATEGIGVGIYGAFALLGLRYSWRWLALGWAVHPLWDVGLHLLSESEAFVPLWYVILCISFDLAVASTVLAINVLAINSKSISRQFEMNFPNRSQSILLAIVVLNLISTWLHYSDNAIHLDQYSGFDWFTPAGVWGTVIGMTPIGLLGYWLYCRQSLGLAYLLLGVYSLTSLSSPGHYLLPIVVPMSLKMHGLIWLDALSGLALIGFLVWSSAVAQEWRVSGGLPKT